MPDEGAVERRARLIEALQLYLAKLAEHGMLLPAHQQQPSESLADTQVAGASLGLPRGIRYSCPRRRRSPTAPGLRSGTRSRGAMLRAGSRNGRLIVSPVGATISRICQAQSSGDIGDRSALADWVEYQSPACESRSYQERDRRASGSRGCQWI
jgi:hypothetical protein